MIDPNALKSIEDLHRLKTEGIITEEEFEKTKERLLFGRADTVRPSFSLGQPSAPVELPAKTDHIGWITLPLKRYADFNGRSGRREFWMFQILPLGALVLAFLTIVEGGRSYRGFDPLSGLVLVALCVGMLGLVVPQFAVQARRLHDQDRSGWLVLFNFLPYIGPVIVFVLMLIEGTKGPNRYGDEPNEG